MTALLATLGRGYLLPLGVTLITLIVSQFIGATGWAAWFPWTVAVFSGIPGSQVSGASVLLVIITGAAETAATLRWWQHSDQAWWNPRSQNISVRLIRSSTSPGRLRPPSLSPAAGNRPRRVLSGLIVPCYPTSNFLSGPHAPAESRPDFRAAPRSSPQSTRSGAAPSPRSSMRSGIHGRTTSSIYSWLHSSNRSSNRSRLHSSIGSRTPRSLRSSAHSRLPGSTSSSAPESTPSTVGGAFAGSARSHVHQGSTAFFALNGM